MAMVLSEIQVSDPGPSWPSCNIVAVLLLSRNVLFNHEYFQVKYVHVFLSYLYVDPSRKAYVAGQGTSHSQGFACIFNIKIILQEKILAHFKHFSPFSY